jgi:hypothetical protein
MGSLSESTRRRAGAVVTTLAFALVGLGFAGCSSSATPHAAPTTTTSSVLTPAITTPTVTIDGHTYQVPTESGTNSIDPSVATGGQIVLTDKGFLPYHLFADINQPITWTNLSSHPVRITFLHMPGKSWRLPVGGSFTYSSPSLIGFEYLSSSGYHGIVSIGVFQ